MEDVKEYYNESEFDYESMWENQEEKVMEKTLDKMSKGSPRKGIKGKYIKPKNHVSKKVLKKQVKEFRKLELNPK